jgi:NADP-dependent 3-hydroxy acid dehydrogenase YdfG
MRNLKQIMKALFSMTKKRVALVTGASSGIGEASAIKLLAAGYTVYGTSRRGSLAGKHPFPLLTLDVTDDASVGAAIEELLRLEGRIDLLVNNAGFGIAPAAAEESSVEQARLMFDTNFLGIVRLTRAVILTCAARAVGALLTSARYLGSFRFRMWHFMLPVSMRSRGIRGHWIMNYARRVSGFLSSNLLT